MTAITISSILKATNFLTESLFFIKIITIENKRKINGFGTRVVKAKNITK